MQADQQSGKNGAPTLRAEFGSPATVADWSVSEFIVPDWPAPSNVRSVFTTRLGGVSGAPYDSLNLGLHVGDSLADVKANRARLQAWMSPGAAVGLVRPVFMDQVHGNQIVALDSQTNDGPQADGALTSLAQLACTVMVADCLPVLLCDKQGSHVAAAHAGWRGLAGQAGRGVLEAAVSALLADSAGAGGTGHGCMAWLGPCIGPDAFEVGDEVRVAFITANRAAQSCFTPLGGGKWLADLPGLARQRLRASGVDHVFGNDGSPKWCTVANPSMFFSYRRDGVTGRMAACIWRVD